MDPGTLKGKRKLILDFIVKSVEQKGYPPSVREIGEAVGLASPSTVHSHLAVLEKQGLIARDPTKPRALEVVANPETGMPVRQRSQHNIPLIGDVAAGLNLLANENIEDYMNVPEQLTGKGEMFMLRVRGESMIEAGIFDGDLVVVRKQPTAEKGDLIVAGIAGQEAIEGTVKYYYPRERQVILKPANELFEDIILNAEDVTIYGKVVSVLRKV